MDLSNLINRPRRKPSAYRRGLWVATLEGFPAIVLLQMLGGPFLTGYLLFLGATSEEIGLVLAVTTLVNVAQIMIAFWMQKITNRKWTLLIFGGLHRVLWAATGIIPFVIAKEWWVPVFIVMYFTAFLSNAAGSVVWSSLVSDMVPAPIRGKYFGLRNTILWAIGAVAIYAGGQILEAYPGGEGFRYLFVICAVCAVLNIVAYAFYPSPPFEKSTESQLGPMLLKPYRDRGFRAAILFLSLFLFLQGVAVPFFNYVMLDVMKLSYESVSFYTIVMTLVMMASYYIWGLLNSRFSAKTLLLWTLPIIAASCLAWGGLALMPAVVVLTLVHVLLGIGTGGFNLLVFNYIIGETPKSERPMFFAVYSTITGIAGFLGPMLGGFMYKQLALFPLWVQQYGVSCAVGLLLALIGMAGKYVFSIQSKEVIKQ
ncbi:MULTISPECIES: MFS transporter [unclassified Paenibacillus]|uniref:MFS transporter n=1 Tax=unclassified Paenibacillus TaxID=185978 RepID=UPI0036256A28